MPRRESESLKRLHVHLFESDYDRLRELYGTNIGIAAAIRKMVRGSIKRMEERAAQREREKKVPLDMSGIREILEQGSDE